MRASLCQSINQLPRGIWEEHIRRNIHWAYFDGASDQRNMCGVGMVIHLKAHRSLKASMGIGEGTHNYVELQTLKLLLYWLTHLGITSVTL